MNARARVEARVLRRAQQEGVHLVVDGCAPGWGAKNRKFRGRHSKVLSDEYQTFQDHVWVAWMNAKQPRFDRGGIEITIHVYWPRRRTFEDGFETGFGDVDAVSSAVLDALQDKMDKQGNIVERKCIDNDMRVCRKIVEKFVDKQHPRVEVWVRQV